MNNLENYISAVVHELTSVRMPNRPFENYATSWEDVVKKIYLNDEFGEQLAKTGYFEGDLKLLLDNVNSNPEKIAIIFNHIKSNMNWNGTYGYYTDLGVKKAYQSKVGNVADINLALTAMLRAAGIEANPVLLSTRSNGISLFPSRNAFNYVITAVEIENEVILLDATNKFSLPNILPIRDINWFGRIVRKNGSSAQVDLMPKNLSKDYISSMISIGQKGEIEGKIKEQYSDYNAFQFRDNNISLSNEAYLEKLEKKFDNIEVSDYVLENKTDLTKPIIESYSFKHNNSIEIIADKMYFSSSFVFY